MIVTANELERFHRFIGDRLGGGQAMLTPEQCLEDWRLTNPDTQELDESVTAVEMALDQKSRGLGIPFEEFDAAFRVRHAISAPTK